MFITAKKQSRHLNSAVRADLVHPSCKAGNRSSSNPSLPEHSYQCSWWPRIMPRRLSPQWYRTALMLQGEDSLAVFLLAFLFQQKTWLTWWETPLALVAIPALFQGCQCPAVEQHSVQSNASSKLFPSCPNDVLRTYKGYNVRIILHFFFFFFFTGGSCIAVLSWIWYVQQGWLFSLKASKCAYWKILVTNFYLNKLHIWASITMRLAYSFFILHLIRKGVKMFQIQIWRFYSVSFFNNVVS